MDVICHKWNKTFLKIPVMILYVTQIFVIHTYLVCPPRSTHYFLSTASMSGVLFAVELKEAQKIKPGVCLQSAGLHRAVTVVVLPHSELHKLTTSQRQRELSTVALLNKL